MQYLGGYQNKATIILPASAITETLTGFPCPVKLPVNFLTNGYGDGLHDVLGSGLTNRKRIDFAIGEMYLNTAIKDWVTGCFFVSIPSYLYTSNTELNLYYGGASQDSIYVGDVAAGDSAAEAVLDSNYDVALDFAYDFATGGAAVYDSRATPNNFNGYNPDDVDFIDTQFGKGYAINVGSGIGEVVDLAPTWSAYGGGEYTIEAFFKTSETTDHVELAFQYDNGTNIIGLQLDKNDSWKPILESYPDGNFKGDTGLADGDWHYVAGKRDSSGYMHIVTDTVVKSNTSVLGAPTSYTGTGYMYCGRSPWGDYGELTICYLRFSKIARSDSWLKATGMGLAGTLLTFEGITQIVKGVQTTRNILADVIPGIQTSINLFGNLQAVRTIENLIGNIFDIQTILTSSGLAGVQTSQNSFSEKLTGLQSVMMRLTDDLKSGQQTISNSLISEIYGVQTSLNLIVEGLTGIQPIRNLISGDGIDGVHTVQNTIDLKDVIYGLQSIIFSMEEVKPIIFSVSQAQNPGEGVAISGPIIPPGASGIAIAIFLDGKNITQKVDKPTVSISQDSIHNTITMNSINQELWAQSDPELNPGAVRIVFQIGTRQMEFLLEERDGDYKSFRMWGRSASAKDSAQYVENIIYSASDRKSAKETAEGFLVNLVIDWEVCDWLLPDGYEYEGDPVDGVQAIAGIIGAVVRTQDDGNLTVRYRNSIRPYDVPNQSPVARYNTNNEVFSISYKNEKGLNYQGVEVFGDARDLPAPDLEVLESDLTQGEVCHIKAYFLTENTPDLEMLLTAGTIRYIGEYEEKIEDVDVTFQEYTSTVSKPILGIKGIEWIGLRGGIISFEPYQKEFTCEEQYAICKLSYVTKYRKYEVANHDVEKLLAVFSSVGYPDISVKVVLDGVENPIMAPAIVDENLTNQEAAVAVGKNYIDDTIYDKTVFSFESPYNEACMDGEIVYIQSDREHFAGNVMVKNAPISFDGVKITQSIEAVRWLV